MKNEKIFIFTILALFCLPTIISAKTITCTTTTNYIVGKNPYEESSVKCSEGIPEIFAVIEQNTGYIGSDEVCKEGKTYSLDIILTYDFQLGDEVIIDGINQGYIFPSSFWHITSKEILAKALDVSEPIVPGEEQEIQVSPNQAEETTDDVSENKIYYEIKFDVNGGNQKINNIMVLEGEKIVMPKDPTRTDYIFTGWYYNGIKFDFKNIPTSNMTLVANWEEDIFNKENIPFIKLTDLSVPYVGSKLDTSIKIATFTDWSADIFSIEVGYKRGKDKEKINEDIVNASSHIVEVGYYYMPYITIIPGKNYTLTNTLITLNQKNVTVSKDENKAIITGQIYGPLTSGVNVQSIIVIPDYTTKIAKDESFENWNIEYYINDHNIDKDDVVVTKGCITLSNTKDFKTSGCPETSGSFLNLSHSSMMDGYIRHITTISLINKNPGTYSTDIILTDVKGRKYKSTYTIIRSENDSEKVSIESDSVLATFNGESSKHWVLSAVDLTNQELGKKLLANTHISDIGSLILVKDIKVISEDGEKTNGEVTIKILLSAKMRQYKNYNFVYVSEDLSGNILLGEIIRAQLDGEYLVVKLPHLSTYAIFGDNGDMVVNDNVNNKLIYIICGIACLIIILLLFLILKSRKRKIQFNINKN